MTPAETHAVSEVVGIVGSGGGLALLGFLSAKVLPLAKRWLSLMEAQEALCRAQLKALGEDPPKASEVAGDLRAIRTAVEAHSAA